jgi:predicted aldo/keto reductase-like oxidoreductase
MMDRIRQYERDSGLDVYGLGAKRIPWEHTLNKFHKELIKDTVQTLINHGYTDAAQCLHDIHFGVTAP